MFRYYAVGIEFTEMLLGTQPTEPKAREFMEEREDEEVPISIPGKITFYRKDNRPVLMNYQLKGFFKAAAEVFPEYLGVAGKKKEYPSPAIIRGYIDRWLFISPRYIAMTNVDGSIKDDIDGMVVYKVVSTGIVRENGVDGTMTHYLRGMTRRGERVTPLDSDYMREGTRVSFIVSVVEKSSITEESIRAWLKYGELGIGLLGWRTAGYGTFKVVEFRMLENKIGG